MNEPEPDHESDRELLDVLKKAIECGNTGVIDRIVGSAEHEPDLPMFPLDLPTKTRLLDLQTEKVGTMTEHYYQLHATAGHLRSYRGKPVISVTALREGVLRAGNSPTPELVLHSVFARSPREWDGRPAVVNHPTRNGEQVSANDPDILAAQGVGTIFNSRVENRRLKMDVHLDSRQMQRIDPDLFDRLRAGEQCDVSVGAYVVTEPIEGEYDGKPYASVWKSVSPDHIAFVERGACSCSDGCGANLHAAEAITGEPKPGHAVTSRNRVTVDPLDGYAAGLALRAAEEGRTRTTDDEAVSNAAVFRDQFFDAMLTGQAAARSPATSTVHLQPPDPYSAEALQKWRDQR